MTSIRKVYRITVFIPPDNVPVLQSALKETTLVQYGKYSDVLWISAAGDESFTPLSGATPTLGTEGETTTAPSVQVIFSIERNEAILGPVIVAIRSAHPWEEPVVYIDETLAVSSQS